MNKLDITLITIFVVITSYIFSQILAYDAISRLIEFSIVPIITILYFFKNKDKSHWFSLFLGLYSIGDILHYIDYENESNLMYYVCNLLYIIAYGFLLIEIYKFISFKNIIKTSPVQLSILVVLSVFMTYQLVRFLNPVEFLGDHFFLIHMLEGAYNVMLLFILTLSLLSFIEHSTHKTFLMFCGCFFVLFSELILLDYYYFSGNTLPNVISGILYLLAFFCFYFQSITPKTASAIMSDSS